MKRVLHNARVGRLAALVVCSWLLASCAVYTPPRPQLTGVVDPATLPGGVRTAEWDLGAVRYAWQGVGINYLETGLEPVLLIVRNHSGRTPVIYPQECYGIGANGMYIAPYAVPQAAEVVFASTAYRKSAEAALVGGLTGAAVGAGLGALIGSGFNHGWGAGPGALIGAGIGALGGAAVAQQPSLEQYRSSLYQEMTTYAWQANPIVPTALVPGWLYFPAGSGIHSLSLKLRVDNQIQEYVVPVGNPVW
jgi:hypothetical protein